MNSKGIGISHLPNQRYRSFCKKGINYNIMLIGSGGAGKSTFINRLFQTEIIPKKVPEKSIITYKNNFGHDNATEIPENFNYKDSLVNFQITNVQMIDKRFNIKICITEVDNVGDKIDNTDCWVPIRNYINDHFSDYFIESKNNVKALIEDKRIHVCLYFIDACNSPCREVDIRVMKEIGELCNLIPVISKCDILIEDEMHTFYEQIINCLEKNEIMIYWPKDDIVKPPYFVIGQRQGRWGTITDNSDFATIKDVLVQSGMIDLVEKTEKFYENYRANVIMKEVEDTKMTGDDVKLSVEFVERLKEDEYLIERAKSLCESKKINEEKKEQFGDAS